MVNNAAIGIVTIHEANMEPTILRSIAVIPRARPTPTIAPTSVWVVDIGRPIFEQVSTVNIPAKSAATPREGVISVTLVPTRRITR